MATIIFDFDSTIISCESLELILEQTVSQSPKLQERIKRLTLEGMRGEISFADSLARRLAIAEPTREQVLAFGKSAHQFLTLGMEELIKDLHARCIDVWIVSGGIIESVLPLGKRLEIPRNQIQAVKLIWGDNGALERVDETVSFCRSKVEGATPFKKNWESPTVAVGDSMSDYRLFEEGIVEHFIAFTEHFRCEEVLVKGVPEAKNARELKSIIKGIIDG